MSRGQGGSRGDKFREGDWLRSSQTPWPLFRQRNGGFEPSDKMRKKPEAQRDGHLCRPQMPRSAERAIPGQLITKARDINHPSCLHWHLLWGSEVHAASSTFRPRTHCPALSSLSHLPISSPGSPALPTQDPSTGVSEPAAGVAVALTVPPPCPVFSLNPMPQAQVLLEQGAQPNLNHSAAELETRPRPMTRLHP